MSGGLRLDNKGLPSTRGEIFAHDVIIDDLFEDTSKNEFIMLGQYILERYICVETRATRPKIDKQGFTELNNRSKARQKPGLQGVSQ